jgi:hypothetical protein
MKELTKLSQLRRINKSCCGSTHKKAVNLLNAIEVELGDLRAVVSDPDECLASEWNTAKVRIEQLEALQVALSRVLHFKI